MIYNLSTQDGQEQARARLDALTARGAFVEITDKTCKTSNQNRYLHAIIGYFGAVLGYPSDYVKSEFFKRAANRDLFVVERANRDGVVYETLRSVKELSKEETTEAITRFRNWAATEARLYLPSAEDLAAVNYMETIIAQNAEFL